MEEIWWRMFVSDVKGKDAEVMVGSEIEMMLLDSDLMILL